MPVTVRSFAKINLGLCIGDLRPDGFHELRTVYQTLALHDVIRLRLVRGTGIEIRCADPRVPTDQSNTCYRILERATDAFQARARVVVEIEKKLPVQGGLGAASSNAIASLLGLERVLKKQLSGPEKIRIAAEVGSDVPLFLLGGTVLGTGRGEEVYPLPDLPAISSVVAMPKVSVSTPKAFADWDLMVGESKLTAPSASDRISEFSSKISAWLNRSSLRNIQGDIFSRRKKFGGGKAKSAKPLSGVPVSITRGRAETPLLDLVRAGIENDFEKVVFRENPELCEAKRVLENAGAFYASLSGSGSVIYGLFQSGQLARKAAAALVKSGIPAETTETLARAQYWRQFLVSDS